jgi:hypothetical protein
LRAEEIPPHLRPLATGKLLRHQLGAVAVVARGVEKELRCDGLPVADPELVRAVARRDVEAMQPKAIIASTGPRVGAERQQAIKGMREVMLEGG